MIPGIVDRALDWAVVPGYTSLGYRLRSRDWNGDMPADALAGKNVLVTGASGGIGEASAEGLARLGATVHMLARNPQRGADAVERVAQRLEGHVDEPRDRLELELCDVSDLAEVADFAANFTARVPELHGLLHNAGVLPARRERSRQGRELTFATNVLGPYLLTNKLLPALRRGAPSRVVLLSSGGMYTARLDLDDLELEQREFDGARFYAHTKRIEVILAELWAEREREHGVSFSALHPGWVDTPGLEASLPRFHRIVRPLLRDPGQGADTAVWLLATPASDERPGAFWHDRRARPEHRVPWTRESAEERRELWRRLAALTGWRDDDETDRKGA